MFTSTVPMSMNQSKGFQSKHTVPLHHEYDKWDYLKVGKDVDFELDAAGDGDKFKGFFRRQGDPTAVLRETENKRLEDRLVNHDRKRNVYLSDTLNRNGFNPVSNNEWETTRDNFKPRGTKYINDRGGEAREVEKAVLERDVQFRFYRIEDPTEPRTAHRARLLVDAGLRGVHAQRMASVIGFGRSDIPSTGAADAFSNANYGGEIRTEDWVRMHQSLRSSSEGLPSSASSPANTSTNNIRTDVPFFMQQSATSVWDVGRLDPDTIRRRNAATMRAPNRIFDTTSPAVLLHALPDPVHRAIRENAELLRSRPPRPIDRPASFTANATMLATKRAQSSKQNEIDYVRNLKM